LNIRTLLIPSRNRLTSPIIDGVVTTIKGLTMPAFTASGHITLGAAIGLKSTNMMLIEGAPTEWHVRDSGDTVFRSLKLENLILNLSMSGSAAVCYLQPKYDNDSAIILRAYDNVDAMVEVAKLESAATPTFDLLAGRLTGPLTLNAQNLVSDTTTGTEIATAADQKLGFFGATPVAQQTKAAHNNWAAVSDVVNALVSLGFFDAA